MKRFIMAVTLAFCFTCIPGNVPADKLNEWTFEQDPAGLTLRQATNSGADHAVFSAGGGGFLETDGAGQLLCTHSGSGSNGLWTSGAILDADVADVSAGVQYFRCDLNYDLRRVDLGNGMVLGLSIIDSTGTNVAGITFVSASPEDISVPDGYTLTAVDTNMFFSGRLSVIGRLNLTERILSVWYNRFDENNPSVSNIPVKVTSIDKLRFQATGDFRPDGSQDYVAVDNIITASTWAEISGIGDIQAAASELIGGTPSEWCFSDFDTTGVWEYPAAGAGWSVNNLVADISTSATNEAVLNRLSPGHYYEVYVVAGGTTNPAETSHNWAIQAGFYSNAYLLSTANIALDGTIPKVNLGRYGIVNGDPASSPFAKDSATSMYAVKLGTLQADADGSGRVYLHTGVGVQDALATGDRCVYDGLLYREVSAPAHPDDLQSDTWVAVDAGGRALPGYAEAGAEKSHRTIGIFYFLWHGQHSQSGPWDTTKLLAANPTNPAWGPVNDFHHWGESEMGYYRSDDPYVIRRHASMLVDAGVDVIIFDVTNGFIYENVYKKLCAVYMQIRAEGGKTPQICFMTHSSSVSVTQNLYDRFYSKGLYKDLWFYWKGKPLIFADLTGHSAAVSGFFTIRHSWAWDAGQDSWSFMELTTSGNYGWHESSGVPEETPVCVAQHPTSNIGRSYHDGQQAAVNEYSLTGTEGEGLYFNEQWTRAMAIDPEFLFVTGWNEWTAQRFIATERLFYAGRWLEIGGSYFVDSYNLEFNRDIEPMKSGTTDNYYYQLISNIRKYKGVGPPVTGESHAIAVDGSFGDWDPVAAIYYDTYGDTVSRDWRGWGTNGLAYYNQTGRNDILQSRVTFDGTNLYFYVETASDLTSCTDPHWMELLINSDQNYSTGWEGYDYRIGSYAVDGTATVKSGTTNGVWATVGSSSFHMNGNKMELSVPRALLGQTAQSIGFDFHWADNIQIENDIAEFSISGDSAPNRRFNYRFSTVPVEDQSGLAFHFITDGDFEGWDANTQNISGFAVSNGAISGTAVTADPHFETQTIDFNGAQIPVIAVRLRASAAGTVQLYWMPEGGGWNSLDAEYTRTGEWQIVEFKCSKNTAWQGQRITRLRLDPVNVAGTEFEIDWIRSANNDADADGLSDNIEGLLDTDQDGIPDYLDEDSDNDGSSDLYENIVGSDSVNPADGGGILYLNWLRSSGNMQFNLPGRSGRLYSLQWTDSLISPGWISVKTAGPLVIDEPVAFTNSMVSSNGFYRVRVVHP